MGFSLSPSVTVIETDLTLYVPNVASSIGAFVGAFQWGAVEEIKQVDSEKELVETFGQPDDATFADWFSAFNYLAYSSNLKAVRVVGTGALNAAAGVADGATESQTDFVFAAAGKTITTTAGDFSSFADGDKIVVSGTTNNDGIFTISGAPTTTVITVTEVVVDETPGTSVTVTAWDGTFDATNSSGTLVKNSDDFETSRTTIEATKNGVIAKYPGTRGNDFSVSICDITSYSTWTYKNNFGRTPDADEIFVVVLEDGNIVEQWEVSKDPTAISTVTGGSNYAETVINRGSKYIWLVPANLWVQDGSVYTPVDFEGVLSAGAAGAAPADADYQTGWDMFVDPEEFDINLLVTGSVSDTVGDYVIDNVAEVRKDCVVFVSPQVDDVVGVVDDATRITNITSTRGTFGSSSYAVMDCNYKYQYDKYNDKYRWVPLNGDIAGLCAYTDFIRDPWWSPAGLNRGRIKNVTKLAWNPTKADRDDLYVQNVNPVSIFRGEGAVLYGDKTLQTKPSAFDRINIRRLFIVLEKAISTAAKYMLFEFNDQYTRARFVTMVEPYLRTIKGRRGIYDFKVICDETNNTGEVIDRNEFVGDIYIKPARSINFIYLNFIAVSSSVTFEEVVLNQ